MKDVEAKLRNLQISPRKVRYIADMVRGVPVSEAQRALSHSPRVASTPILKLINSAVANADHNFKMDTSTLRVKAIMVGEGPMLKRYRPRAFGRAGMIRKRMSHVKVVLEGEETATKASTNKKDATVEKPKVEKEEQTDKSQEAVDQERQKPIKAPKQKPPKSPTMKAAPRHQDKGGSGK